MVAGFYWKPWFLVTLNYHTVYFSFNRMLWSYCSARSTSHTKMTPCMTTTMKVTTVVLTLWFTYIWIKSSAFNFSVCLCINTCSIFFSGSVRWASKERQIFRQHFRTKGKEFGELQKDVSYLYVTPKVFHFWQIYLHVLSIPNLCMLLFFVNALSSSEWSQCCRQSIGF